MIAVGLARSTLNSGSQEKQTMATRRARSAERVPDPAGDGLDRLANLMERLLAQQAVAPPAPVQQPPQIIQVPQPARESFKAPEYNGSGDVEFFIRQFTDVANANGWNEGATLLHLRAKLKDVAQDCGQKQSVEAVCNALRSRFGTSVREARTRLNDLKKSYKTSLHEHAVEVEKLVELAYADLPRECKLEMCIDKFTNTLGNAYLQRHLLAIPTPDLESAVRAGNEYLQIKNVQSNPGLRAIIADEEEEAQRVAPVVTNNTQDTMQLIKLVSQLTQELAEIKSKVNTPPAGPPPRTDNSLVPRLPNVCWICNGSGHWRRDCPKRPRGEQGYNNNYNAQRSGNGRSPQQ